MDAMVFRERVKHDRLDLHPGVVYGFEDPDARPYFVEGLGWAETSTDEPQVVISQDECSIDPETVFGSGPNQGKRVMEVAANG